MQGKALEKPSEQKYFNGSQKKDVIKIESEGEEKKEEMYLALSSRMKVIPCSPHKYVTILKDKLTFFL